MSQLYGRNAVGRESEAHAQSHPQQPQCEDCGNEMDECVCMGDEALDVFDFDGYDEGEKE